MSDRNMLTKQCDHIGLTRLDNEYALTYACETCKAEFRAQAQPSEERCAHGVWKGDRCYRCSPDEPETRPDIVAWLDQQADTGAHRCAEAARLIERLSRKCAALALLQYGPVEPSQEAVQAELDRDELLFGSSFCRLVDGRKVRIPPQEIVFTKRPVAEPRASLEDCPVCDGIDPNCGQPCTPKASRVPDEPKCKCTWETPFAQVDCPVHGMRAVLNRGGDV